MEDKTVGGSSKDGLTWTERQLAKCFNFKDQRAARYTLGLEIYRDRTKKGIYLWQRKHVREVRQKFGVQGCRPVATPLDKTAFRADDGPTTPEVKMTMHGALYMDVIGALPAKQSCSAVSSHFCLDLVSDELSQLAYMVTDANFLGDDDKRRSAPLRLYRQQEQNILQQ